GGRALPRVARGRPSASRGPGARAGWPPRRRPRRDRPRAIATPSPHADSRRARLLALAVGDLLAPGPLRPLRVRTLSGRASAARAMAADRAASSASARGADRAAEARQRDAEEGAPDP